MRGSIKIVLITAASSGAIALSVGKSQADPGGFALRQSPYFQGTSFAGVAAGGASVSSMFWNPATITHAGRGFTIEGDATIDSPHADITPLAATSPTGVNLTPLGGSSDLFDKASFVPSAYAVYGLNNGISFGLAFNSPFGLKTQPNALWSGMFYAQESNIKDINATPTVAWKINNWLSVGAAARRDNPAAVTQLPLEFVDDTLGFNPEWIVDRIAPRPVLFITTEDAVWCRRRRARRCLRAPASPRSSWS